VATATLRLEGGVARVFRDRLLPQLSHGPSRADLRAGMTDLPVDEVDRVLDHLVRAGLLEEVQAGRPEPPAWTHLVAAPSDRAALAARVAGMRVAVLGLRGAGQVVAEVLASTGVGGLVLVDPFPPLAGEPAAAGNGHSREQLVADSLRARWPATAVSTSDRPLAREEVAGLVDGMDVVVTAVEPELAAARLWVNTASLESGVPSLHAELNGSRAVLGPLVVPGEGPCYLCWRMRALACADDFPAAMAREELLDAARRPFDPPRPLLPPLPHWAASILAREVMALGLGVASPQLAGHVLELDALDLGQRLHAVLPRPDCPACSKKDHRPRPGSSTSRELAVEPARTTDFGAIAAATVGPLCGLVRSMERISKHVEEPEQPIVVRAELANSRFLPGSNGFVGCSGKGSTVAIARNGALGEALERHAALTWTPDRQVSAPRGDLTGPSLDPRDLVLFADDQYASLHYAPYEESTVLDWVPARSLVTGLEVWVPLLAVHLGYEAHRHSAHLFSPTSNGFAAGPTTTSAVLRGLLEVVERDAFLLSWFHRLPGTRSGAGTVPDAETRSVAAAYARRGVSIDVHRLPVDSAATVVLAVGWSDDRPAAVVGLGADLDPVVAARRAVLEVGQVRPALRARLGQPETAARLAELVDDPSRVASLEDHDLLYADPASAQTGLAHLRSAPREPWDAGARLAEDDWPALDLLVESLRRAAGDVLYVDVTTPDVADLGVRVACGIVPGFQPIHFGAHEMRLGGDRLYTFPASLGLRPDRVGRDELNLAPHPLS
jgi:bacteriocin biosynthesis cyclodehydratase domain-containing protein